MFYPKCPICQGKSESSEASPAWTQTRVPPGVLSKAPTPMKVAGIGLGVAKGAREVWKRVPGGGNKRCTVCGHHFS